MLEYIRIRLTRSLQKYAVLFATSQLCGNMQGKKIINYLKLIIMFLRHIRLQSICFRAPAKYFPLKSLYSKSKICSYKIYFFHIQFKIIGSKHLAEIQPVLELVYTKYIAWFCSSFAIKVLYSYRLISSRFQEFCVINRKVCDVVLIALVVHLVLWWPSCFVQLVF